MRAVLDLYSGYRSAAVLSILTDCDQTLFPDFEENIGPSALSRPPGTLVPVDFNLPFYDDQKVYMAGLISYIKKVNN